MFSVEVAIKQGDGCCIPIHVHNQSGDGFNTYFLAGVQAPVSGDHLIFSVLYKPDYHGVQHTLGPDAFDQLVHFFVVQNLKGVAFEGMQLVYLQYIGVSPESYAVIILISKIFDAINDIVIGNLVDTKKIGKKSKYMPWILLGGVALVFGVQARTAVLPKDAFERVAVFGKRHHDLPIVGIGLRATNDLVAA